MGDHHKEVLKKYKGVYDEFKRGKTVSLTHPEKEELAKVRLDLTGMTTNIFCAPCIIELLNDVFRNYVQEPL